jgi:hypothetical protein
MKLHDLHLNTTGGEVRLGDARILGRNADHAEMTVEIVDAAWRIL